MAERTSAVQGRSGTDFRCTGQRPASEYSEAGRISFSTPELCSGDVSGTDFRYTLYLIPYLYY